MRTNIAFSVSLAFSLVVVPALVAGCERPERELEVGKISIANSAVATAAKRGASANRRVRRVVSLEEATALAKRVIIVDGHIDLPYRQHKFEKNKKAIVDTTVKSTEGDFDAVRAREGGLNAPFMSIYTPADLEGTGKSKAEADHLIDLVLDMEKMHPETYVVARSPADVRAAFTANKIALPMGMENGSPLEEKLENVAYFHQRGIRYITLAHSKDNHLADSSYDERHTAKGLTPFGNKVVDEMNRVGILIDVAHLSDDAVAQAVQRSAVAVIASHSSCRHYTPGFERNLSDVLIRKIAAKGGVVQINFGSTFISDNSRKVFGGLRDKLSAKLEEKKLERGTPLGDALVDAFYKTNPGAYATVSDVADHIQYVADLVGVKHVGFGSDFDGVGDSLPTDLKDVSMYPRLIRELLSRGFTDKDLQNIAGENVLRVWANAEAFATAQAISPR